MSRISNEVDVNSTPVEGYDPQGIILTIDGEDVDTFWGDENNNEFINHLRYASEEVSKWPKWKKGGSLPTILSDEQYTGDIGDAHEFDDPNGSVWVVAVDIAGNVTILETPNVCGDILDNGPEAENLGLPAKVENLCPGIYRWTCSYHIYTEEDFCFEIEDSELIWSPEHD